jgi:AAA domain
MTEPAPDWPSIDELVRLMRGTYGDPQAEPPAASDGSTDPAATADDEQPFRPEPVDWPAVIAGGVPELKWLDEPYLPARKRIWGVGAAESGKSIWAACKTARVTRARLLVVYISQENGLEEEVRRFLRIGPDFDRLRLYVDQGFDLAIPTHRDVLLELSAGAALVVLDTFTACWSGDEDSNNHLAAFDRDVMKPLTVAGSSVLVLDHTGNPQPFTRRRAA